MAEFLARLLCGAAGVLIGVGVASGVGWLAAIGVVLFAVLLMTLPERND